MPTSGEIGPELLLDTSAAVALCLVDHEGHDGVRDAVDGRRLGLAGHAAFESFSVLTRLPPPHRRTPSAVARLLTANFGYSRFLSPAASAALHAQLVDLEVSGGAVYDALVGASAVEYGIPLLTRDRRALGIYRVLAVQVIMVR